MIRFLTAKICWINHETFVAQFEPKLHLHGEVSFVAVFYEINYSEKLYKCYSNVENSYTYVLILIILLIILFILIILILINLHTLIQDRIRWFMLDKHCYGIVELTSMQTRQKPQANSSQLKLQKWFRGFRSCKHKKSNGCGTWL